jgi:hypothetical protein
MGMVNKMERITLTSEQQAEIEAKRVELGTTPETVIIEGSNLKMDDHLQIDNSWEGVVVGPESGVVCFYVPAWPLLFAVDIEPYITDRIGPNGEVMPIFDPEQAEARAAGKAEAVEADKENGHHRTIEQSLKDAIKRLPHDQQSSARKLLKEKGVLKHD